MTGKREEIAMHDLVKQETERVESRFLEPACGTGNFLTQILERKLTDYWKDHDIKDDEEYAILTNIIHQEWSGVSVGDHKEIKGLKNHVIFKHEYRN